MRLMLTSCGLETEQVKQCYLDLLGKDPTQVNALFIPTAAIDAGVIGVLPKCMNDLLKCGIPEDHITVFDLHRNMSADELSHFDTVYLCGGRTSYLLERINDTGFRQSLLDYIHNDGCVLGVSAGSLVFSANLPDNLGLVPVRMDVHCGTGDAPGPVDFRQASSVRLSNTAAMVIRSLPGSIMIIDHE